MKNKIVLRLFSTFAVLLITGTAKAESWTCKEKSRNLTLNVQVAADGQAKAQLGDLFSFGAVDLAGNSDQVSGALMGHDMWEAKINLEKSRERANVGKAHINLYMFIDCVGDDTIDADMECEISE